VAEDERNLDVGPARKTTLVESMMEQIIDLVREGKLSLGERLPSEHKLMTMMGVSRSTVREALKGLVVMGLIETHAGRRSLVKALPNSLARSNGVPATFILERDIRQQILPVRELLDPEFSSWAIREATEEDLATLKRRFDAFASALTHHHWKESHVSHREFHLALAAATHNVAAVWVVDKLISAIPLALSQKYHCVWEEQLSVHKAILDALISRDELSLRAAMLAHLDLERIAITMLPTE
jgi:GntR family transcriptional regulator, transcriptional repressor for pyruvate dehydrogenase complex